MYLSVKRLFLAATLGAFYLVAFARVIDPNWANSDSENIANKLHDELGPKGEDSLESATSRTSHISFLTKKDPYNDAIAKGREIDRAPRQTDRTDGRTEIRRYRTTTENGRARPPRTVRDSLQSDGFPTGDEYIFAEIEEISSRYANYYYQQPNNGYGVIIAEGGFRLRNALLDWSEATYQQYLRYFWRTDGARNLKYIYITAITRIDTHDIMVRAVRESGQCSEWAEFEAGSTEYYAVLGTKNGRGVAHMLNDHPVALHHKTIMSIEVNPAIDAIKFVLSVG